MTLIRPFAGLRPAPGRAAEVLAPPYDVLDTEEARVRARGRPWSFLHISKPEIDLPRGTDPYAPEVYAKAAENLARMSTEGVLVRDPRPYYYAYRLTTEGHTQTGLVAVASVAAYDSNHIRRHEFTRPEKEDDRVRQIEALNAQTGPVLLAYPADAQADALLGGATAGGPEVDVVADTGVRHELWVVRDPDLIDSLTSTFAAMEALYIADGHHRSAAASRVAAARRSGGTGDSRMAQDQYFLSVIFPHHELRILDYNRVVRDLNGHDREAFLQRLQAAFEIQPSANPVHPSAPAEFGLYLPGRWFRLALRPERIPQGDPVARLDVSQLSNQVLGPILRIEDQRRDRRIDFVGGIRGLAELERRVNEGGMAAAFSLYPTRMEDLMAVAEAGEVMPPKSTWFEPKLADGLASHVLD